MQKPTVCLEGSFSHSLPEACGSFVRSGNQGGTRADWTHVYLAVLPMLPAHAPANEAAIAAELRCSSSQDCHFAANIWDLSALSGAAHLDGMQGCNVSAGPAPWLRFGSVEPDHGAQQ